MKQYLLIKGDEDGNHITVITNEDLKDIKQLMEDYGVEIWRKSIDDSDSNPNYWPDNEALLLEIEVKVPKPIKIVEQYEI